MKKQVLSMAIVLLVAGAALAADAVGRRLQSATIWTAPAQTQAGVAIAFRKSFGLAGKPSQAALHLFADARYVLWVNGAYVDRGPARFQPNGPEYDTINLGSHLRAGRNVIALLVVANLSGGKVMRHAPGLTALLDADGKELWQTDASWKWSRQTRFRQINASWADLGDAVIDARVEDGDWTQADYNDAAWQSAAPIDGGSWGALSARRIPLLRETPVAFSLGNNAALPVTLRAGQKLEFTTERIVQAYPVIALEAEAGTELAFEPFGVRYLARAGRQTHFTIDTRGFSHGQIVVKTGKATITNLKLVERLYPYTRLGSFQSNDPFLNRLWEMCARSCEVLSEDCYVDCADRERVEWMDCDPPGFDITRTAMAGPGADGQPVYSDPRLLKEMVRRTALTLQPGGWVKAHTCSDRYDIHAQMEDRACEWVAGIRRYYDATGDTELIREIWPDVTAQMNYFLQRRTPRGLVRARDWVVWGNPLGYATGETTTLNVFVQRALSDAAMLAGRIDDKAAGAKYSQAAADLVKAINTLLWNEAEGSYYSGYFDDADAKGIRLPVTDHRTPSTLHANVFALDRGVVPPERRSRLLNKVLAQQESIDDRQVMIYYYLDRRLYELDRPESDSRVLRLFRQKWQPMVASSWQCSWESLNGGSKAHVYGMFPGYFLSAYVLGVRRDAPVAERKLVIEPRLGDLAEAKGVVVTEFGPVTVSWKRQDRELVFGFEVPKEVHATLRLAEGDASTLVLDGQKVDAAVQGRYVTVGASPGKHEGRLVVTVGGAHAHARSCRDTGRAQAETRTGPMNFGFCGSSRQRFGVEGGQLAHLDAETGKSTNSTK